MPYEFKRQRRVEFAETDMAGILHFANYFRYMEETEHEFFRSLGKRVHAGDAGDGPWGFARVHVECNYQRPLRYEDVAELHLLVREKRSKSIRYEIVFRRHENGASEEVARGAMTVVCVTRDPKTSAMRAAPIPADIDALIEVAPPAP